MTAMERLLSVEEVAQSFGVSNAWVRQHANGHRRPILPSVKIGKFHRFRISDVQQFIADAARDAEVRRKK